MDRSHGLGRKEGGNTATHETVSTSRLRAHYQRIGPMLTTVEWGDALNRGRVQHDKEVP